MPWNQTPESAPEWLAELPEDFDIIWENVDRFARAAGAHDEWAKIATKCTRFLEGEQWTPEELAKLAREGRPANVKNYIAPLFRVLQGYQRQNRYDINFMPANDGTGNQQTAEAITATFKQIAELNQMEWKDSTVFHDGLSTGRGFWDMRMDFSRNTLGEVKVKADDPFSILIDPEADSYNPNDVDGGWGYVIETKWMSPIEIFMLYGKNAFDEIADLGHLSNVASPESYGMYSELTDMPERYFGLDHFNMQYHQYGGGLYHSPLNHINQYRRVVRVIDCQHRKLKKVRYIVDLETGGERIIPDNISGEKLRRIMQWAQMKNLPVDIRTGFKQLVHWTTTAGNRVLWNKWSPYEDRMTKIPYFPYFRRGKTRGFIEDLIDPQTEINKRASAMLHIIMTTANSGWMWEEGALRKDQEEALEQWGARAGLHVKYKEGYNAPSKIEPTAMPASFRALIQDSQDDMKQISGVNDSALGNLDKVQSGRAIQARQKQTIVGAEPYFDNFGRSRELLGDMGLFCIQRFYNEPRVVKAVEGDSQTDENLVINARTAAGDILNAVGQGNYQVVVDETPISATYMQGQWQEMLELIEIGVPIPWDIALRQSTVADKEKIIQRIKEERDLAGNQQLMNNMIQRSQMGIPPEAPLPAVAIPEQLTTEQPAQPMLPAAPQMAVQPPNGQPASVVPQQGQDPLVGQQVA